MKLDRLKTLVKDGKFFTVRFHKRTDGAERVMNCRVRPPVGSGGLRYDPDSEGLLLVWELSRKAWRMIPAENVIEVRAHGQRIA